MAATAAPAATEHSWIEHAPLYLTAAAAVTTEVSIAAFQILMGLALVAMVATQTKFRWPPVALPLAACASLLVLAATKKKLGIGETFPELVRMPLMRAIFA